MIHRTTYSVVILAYISAILLTGCGILSTPTPERLSLTEKEGHYEPQYPNEKGCLFFYWESGFFGILRGIYIDVNGTRIGGLNRGTYFAYEVNPGEVAVAAENRMYEAQTQIVKVEAGERYYFRVTLGIGKRGSGDPRIEMVPNAEGAAATKKLKYATLY